MSVVNYITTVVTNNPHLSEHLDQYCISATLIMDISIRKCIEFSYASLIYQNHSRLMA